MSLHEYRTSLKINIEDYPFYALIMAAMRQADSDNIEKLKFAFPETWEELKLRYDAPGGELDEATEAKYNRVGGFVVYSTDNPPHDNRGSEE